MHAVQTHVVGQLLCFTKEKTGLERLNNLTQNHTDSKCQSLDSSLSDSKHYSLYLITKFSTEFNVSLNRNFKISAKNHLS